MDLARQQQRPRFRTDLVAECIEAEGQRFIDVIDPDTGDAFRFYEVEYSIACAMDGERDLPGLVQWAREELGIEPSASELQQVISTLGHLGYLDTDTAGAAAVAADVAARGRGDDEFGLQRGVVASPREPVPPSGIDFELGAPTMGTRPAVGDEGGLPLGDFELGAAGGKPTARMDPLSAVDDIELGAAAEPMPTLKRSKTRPDQDDDGPTHLPPAAVADFDDEVSVDLSEHLSLRPDDVKEAVRMSRTMKAVEIPPELLDELGEKEAAIAARAEASKQAASAAAATARVEQEQREAMVPVIPRLEPVARLEPSPARAEPVVARVEERKPVELPAKPVVVTKRPEPRESKAPEKRPTENPIAGPQPGGGGTSTVLIVFLVLAILGGGGFLVWKYVLNKPKAESSDSGGGKVKAKDPKGKDPKGKDPKGKDPKVGSGSGTAGVGAGTGTAGVGAGTGTAGVGAGTGTAGTGPGTGAGTGTAGIGPGTGAGTGSAVEVAPPPTATLTAVAAPSGEVNILGKPGEKVAWVVKKGATVKAGDPIAKYKGFEPLEKELGDSSGGLIFDINKRVPNEIVKATAARDKAAKAGQTGVAKAHEKKIAERTKRLAEKQDEAAVLRAKLEVLTVKAPSDGKITAAMSKGKKIPDSGVIAKIGGGGGGEASLTGTFEVAADKISYAAGGDVTVAVKDQPEKTASCTVSKVEGTKVTVSCPASSGLSAGTEVALQP